jgi:phosphorylase kinase alpha/beta subunit
MTDLESSVQDERLAQLDRHFEAIESVILARQHPVTGLLPASTAVTVHGDYTDAWVRDNVYSIYAVWGLTLAYQRHAPEDRKGRELEHAVVRLMRGLLAAMMTQSAKVERFKHTQDALDALHAKYDTATGRPVVADHEWGHLQLDATSLYLLTMTQMIAGGIDLIWSPVEVAFVQNLIYYIGRAYRTPDYGVWERGNKINHGHREINASSVGIALAALESLDGFDLYGSRGDRTTQVHVLPDEIARARMTLHSLLPWESASKEVDAATLAVIGFPAFAVTDEELTNRTRSKIVERLQGRCGCKRFLRDGHQTVLEDTKRLHYEPSELKVFENIECEWPLFFTYLLLDAHYRGDSEAAADYRSRLEQLEQKRDGIGLLPELYYVPASSIAAEKKNPGSQTRLPNDNVPLVWAQSLWWLAQMLQDGLLERSDMDPLGRHRSRPKPSVPVQIALLAEDVETQTQLADLGIIVDRLDQLETVELRPARELARFYGSQGASLVLGLTGRPQRRLRSLTTSRFYRLGDRRLAFAPSVLADHQDYLAMDMAILGQRLRAEVAYLSRNWQGQGRPTFVLPLGQRHLGARTEHLVALLQEWRDGRCGPIAVRLGPLGQLMPSASWMSLDPDVGAIPAADRSVGPGSTSMFRRGPRNDSPLSAAEERTLALEAEQDRLCLVQRLRDSNNIYEQAECLQGLVLLLGREAEIPWTGLEAGLSSDSQSGSIALESLLDQLWEHASRGRHWSVLRRVAGLRGWLDAGLEEAVTNLLVRQKQLLIGKAYSPDSLITEPMTGQAIADRIARFSREDLRERVLTQEILLGLDGLMKVNPELLQGFLTLRVGHLILLLTAEVAAESHLTQDEAYEKLLGFSPSEVQSRLAKVLGDYAEAAELLRNQETLNLKPGIEVKWHPEVQREQMTSHSSSTPAAGWLDYRLRGGALGQVPKGFYQGVWRILHHCRGLVIGDKLERRNRMDSASFLAEMTAGEKNFALAVEHLLAKINAPEYRHLTIEALVALSDFCRKNRDFGLTGHLVLDVLIGHGVRLAWLQDHAEDSYEGDKALAWQRFYEEPPASVANWIIKALRYLVKQEKSAESALAALA